MGGLVPPQGAPAPYDAMAVNKERAGSQTALIGLEELKRQHVSKEHVLQFMAQHPELFMDQGQGQQGPQSAIMGGGTGQPPMMQQTISPGRAAGQAMAVPAGQSLPWTPSRDLSRFATQGQPPAGSTLGQPGPPPPGQDPLMALMQRDPNAALAVQGRMEKMQDMRLERTIKETEYVGRVFQGVTDDASYGPARAEIARVLPQYAAQLPPTYSKAAVQPYIDRAVAVGEKAKWDLDVATALKRNVEAKLLPEMFRAIGQEGTLAAPAGTGTTPNGATPPPSRQPVAAPAEYESAITDATKLYPQVKPERVKAIIAAESNFDAKAVSSAGAKGPMQLMDATAKNMGVEDPFNVQQNVRGGTRYYAQMLTKYGGDERKALAAYNWGPANLDKVHGDVSKAPAETQAYVQKVLSGGGGGGTGTAQAPAANPRIAELDGLIKRAEVRSQQASVLGNESWATQLNNQANRLVQERTRLQDEDRRVQERAEETPRALERERLLTEQKQGLERQRQAQPMLPEDRRKFLTGLRSDIRAEPTFKIYQEMRNGYQNVRTGADRDSAEGDLALIYGIAKILDPGSVVRESEFATVEAAQGKLQQLLNTPQKFFEGDRLTPENRKQLLLMAHSLANEKLTTAQKELRAVYEPLAKEGNIDFNQLLPLEDLKPLTKPVKALSLEEAKAERARIREASQERD